MSRIAFSTLVAGVLSIVPASANPLMLGPQAAPVGVAPAPAPQVRYAAAPRSELGGGFIEFLFGQQPGPRMPQVYQQPYQPQLGPDVGRPYQEPGYARRPVYGPAEPELDLAPHEPSRRQMDPRYARQMVDYQGKEAPGTIIIDTPRRFLFLVQGGGKAMRYGIGVGRPGFTWAGVKSITRKAEWPDWRPPDEMLRRRPDLPRHMAGGPDNPLGARAMYLGSSLYRIHGSNEPWTIGTAVSSGCIRMRNEDVIDLYNRVKVGTKVVVI